MFFLQKLTAQQNWSANLAVKWVGGIKYKMNVGWVEA